MSLKTDAFQVEVVWYCISCHVGNVILYSVAWGQKWRNTQGCFFLVSNCFIIPLSDDFCPTSSMYYITTMKLRLKYSLTCSQTYHWIQMYLKNNIYFPLTSKTDLTLLNSRILIFLYVRIHFFCLFLISLFSSTASSLKSFQICQDRTSKLYCH